MNYSRQEVTALVENYARAASMLANPQNALAPSWTRTSRHALAARLMDVDEAIARLSPRVFEALTLVGLKQMTAGEATDETGAHESTIRRRYSKALDDVTSYINDPLNAPPPRRTPGWWDWSLGDEQVRAKTRRRPGRPASTDEELEVRIVVLGCGGATEREIAEAEGVPRSTVRSVLKRYGVQRRRGPRPKPTARQLRGGGVYCVPDDLISAYRAAMPTN